MRKFIIASHHRFAAGLKDTVEFVTGFKPIYNLSAYVDDEDIGNQINQIMNHISTEDEVFIFTDMAGGSVTQKFWPFIAKNVHLICGMNLPLIMACALLDETPLSAEEVSELVLESREQIIYLNQVDIEDGCDDE
ncbi:PTS sugar transporter subunit IIA [Klebsiella spallanzanii]|uniref:PTS EIIA type-4 domain-containing protein n=1 Tax=Klebsiella spallanzanii TaxID=2587528 RepID=A0A564J0E4_9ENTR|nr:hypothetical protein [Klebsiella spallanzanii]VUS50654.1 hypothetical protein SB6408_04258 [Klebsiella spallanzanii]